MILGVAAAGAVGGDRVRQARARRQVPAPLAATGHRRRATRSSRRSAPDRARRTRCTGPGAWPRRPPQRAALDEAYQLRTAAQVAETLGNMKGALMKIGQMASYLDDGMPEPVPRGARVAPAGRAADGAGARARRSCATSSATIRQRVFAAVGSGADRGRVDRPGAPRRHARRPRRRGEGAVPRRRRRDPRRPREHRPALPRARH